MPADRLFLIESPGKTAVIVLIDRTVHLVADSQIRKSAVGIHPAEIQKIADCRIQSTCRGNDIFGLPLPASA